MKHSTATITNLQKKKFYSMIRNARLTDDQKNAIVFAFTDSRTTHVSEMTQDEFANLIDHLRKDDPCEKMKRKVFAILFSLGWIQDGNQDEWKINYAVIDRFLLKKGSVKKRFNQLTCDEVGRVLAQMEKLQKNTKESEIRKEADQAIKEVLGELGIIGSSKR